MNTKFLQQSDNKSNSRALTPIFHQVLSIIFHVLHFHSFLKHMCSYHIYEEKHPNIYRTNLLNLSFNFTLISSIYSLDYTSSVLNVLLLKFCVIHILNETCVNILPLRIAQKAGFTYNSDNSEHTSLSTEF